MTQKQNAEFSNGEFQCLQDQKSVTVKLKGWNHTELFLFPKRNYRLQICSSKTNSRNQATCKFWNFYGSTFIEGHIFGQTSLFCIL